MSDLTLGNVFFPTPKHPFCSQVNINVYRLLQIYFYLWKDFKHICCALITEALHCFSVVSATAAAVVVVFVVVFASLCKRLDWW